jgi:hypothetical protein
MPVRKKALFFVTCSLLFIICNAGVVLAGGKAEGALTQKISTEGLSGITLWLVNFYNQDPRIWFAIIATVTMASVGTAIAFLTDLILKMLGLEVTKISHHE